MLNNYKQRHNAAMQSPKGNYEIAIQHMILGLEHYVTAYTEQYGSLVGDDAIIGDFGVKFISEGLLTLLNGELGRFDAATLDNRIRELANSNKIEIEQ